jgi:hypothetical protein
MKHHTLIEPLEDRIAPATILNPYTVTFQETNGDTAIVKISKPLFKSAPAAGNILNFTTSDGSVETFGGNSVGESLSQINLLGNRAAQDMNISVKVIHEVGFGNPEVDVGSILAANFTVPFQVSENIDLGSIYIQGNLGYIWAGDNFSTPAIKSLTVQSMALAVNSLGQANQSDVLGPILNLDVKGNFNANLDVIGYQYGTINKLVIGGALAGDAAGDPGSGVIQFTGHIGSATIGSIAGSTAAPSLTSSSNLNVDTGELVGSPANSSQIGSLHVLGSITGGAGQDSGRVFAEISIRKVTVGGSVIGGAGQDAGEIAGPLGTVAIAGGVTGGSGQSSGVILGQSLIGGGTTPVSERIGRVTIGGDLAGGSGLNSGNVAGLLGAVTVKGSLTGGAGIGSGAILSQRVETFQIFGSPTTVTIPEAMGAVVIGGNVVGGSAGTAAFAGSGSAAATAAVPGDSGVIEGLSTTGIHIFGSLIGGAAGTAVNGNGTLTQTADTSGAILVNSIPSLLIGGNVTGGTGNNSGEIIATGALGTAAINGNLTGSQMIDSATAVVNSGYIQAGQINALDIKGSVIAGLNSGGKIANSGAIRSSRDIVSLTIGGDVTGTKSNPVVISAQQGVPHPGSLLPDLAIRSVTIGGNATWLDLLAGYGPTVSTTSGSVTNPAGAPLGTPLDGSAQIDLVKIVGNLAASNIVAGAQPDSNGQFGTAGDMAIATKTVFAVQSQIASVIVGGTATGDSTMGDNFGIVSEVLGSVTVMGGANLATGLHAGTPKAVDGTNLFLLEVPNPT